MRIGVKVWRGFNLVAGISSQSLSFLVYLKANVHNWNGSVESLVDGRSLEGKGGALSLPSFPKGKVAPWKPSAVSPKKPCRTA